MKKKNQRSMRDLWLKLSLFKMRKCYKLFFQFMSFNARLCNSIFISFLQITVFVIFNSSINASSKSNNINQSVKRFGMCERRKGTSD